MQKSIDIAIKLQYTCIVRREEKVKLTLKALRTNSNLTQEQAAKKLKISESTLNNYENYKSFPDVQVIERILKLYNVQYDEVIFLPQNCN